LKNSTTLDEETKKRVEPLLTPEYMSSDETAVEDSEDNVSSGSDSEHPTMNHTTKKKKLIKHRLSWEVGNCNKRWTPLTEK